jgi:hypothetical protein
MLDHDGMDHCGRVEPRTLARRQFDAFNEAGREVRISDEERRRILLMSPQEWSAWEAFLTDDGALPAQPAVPVVLLRLANASYRLAVRADRDHAAPRSARELN